MPPSPPPTSFSAPTDTGTLFTGPSVTTTSGTNAGIASMTTPASVSSTATAGDDSNPGGQPDFAKSTLQYVLLSLAVFLIGCMILKRYLRLHRANQPATRFFTPSNPSPVSPFGGNTSFGGPTGLPRSYQPDSRRVRGEAIGTGGQRLDTAVNQDHLVPGDKAEKDLLPAYSKYGSPPQYVESDPAAGSSMPASQTERQVQ